MAKVALVAGANKGIGLETVRQLAQQGFTVYLWTLFILSSVSMVRILSLESRCLLL